MKKKIYEMLMRMMAVASAVGICVGAMPAGYVFAEDVSVTDSVANRTVTANFTVTESDLAEMGYGPKVSIPLTIGLSYLSGSSEYGGTGEIYAYGIINVGKKVSVSINSSNEKMGKIYDAAEVDCTNGEGTGYSCNLTKQSWSKAECYTNYRNHNEGNSVTHSSTLSVRVPRSCFVLSGTGAYKTYVPLKIQLMETRGSKVVSSMSLKID